MAFTTLKEGSASHRAYVIGAWVIGIGILVYIPFAYKVGFAPGSIDKGFRISQLNDVIAYAVALGDATRHPGKYGLHELEGLI